MAFFKPYVSGWKSNSASPWSSFHIITKLCSRIKWVHQAERTISTKWKWDTPINHKSICREMHQERKWFYPSSHQYNEAFSLDYYIYSHPSIQHLQCSCGSNQRVWMAVLCPWKHLFWSTKEQWFNPLGGKKSLLTNNTRKSAANRIYYST